MTNNMQAIKQAIRDKFAWPGGYPLYIVANDGGSFCIQCARAEYKQIAHDTVKKWQTGWDCAGSDINWEDSELLCDHCGEKIESAYGDD